MNIQNLIIKGWYFIFNKFVVRKQDVINSFVSDKMFRSSEGVQTRPPKLDGTGEPYVFKNC